MNRKVQARSRGIKVLDVSVALLGHNYSYSYVVLAKCEHSGFRLAKSQPSFPHAPAFAPLGTEELSVASASRGGCVFFDISTKLKRLKVVGYVFFV